MKTFTVSDKHFEKICKLIRGEISGFKQQIHDCQKILRSWNDSVPTMIGKAYYHKQISTTETKIEEAKKLLEQLNQQNSH